LEQNGKMLCDELLPVDKKKALIDSDADYLLLRINDHLVHIPFELIFIKDQFLCQKFAIGRDVKTQQTVHIDQRKQKSKLSLWGIHNPTGDLDFARNEGTSIRRLLKQYINHKIDIMKIEPNVSRDQVKSRICDYDIVHFASLFYQYLLSGKTLGMAMHKARESVYHFSSRVILCGFLTHVAHSKN
jgi:hypothetical protein